MAKIELDNVWVDFSVYSSDRHLIRRTLSTLTGGQIAWDRADRVVVRAINGVTATFNDGDRVALVGPNGAGKTTLLRTIAQIYAPARGSARVTGKVATLFDLAAGLEMEATGRENIILKGLALGLSNREINHRLDDIVEFSGLGDYLSMPLRTYSSGMVLRLAFSVSTAIDADVVLMDEWITVGDAHFIRKATDRLLAFVNRASILVVASHMSELLCNICSLGVLMSQGYLVTTGPLAQVQQQYAFIDPLPFFDAQSYLDSNPDVKAVVDAGLTKAWHHFLVWGVLERRDLGSGIHTNAFAQDPIYQAALVTNNTPVAVARVAAVAPFLPSFRPPAHWQPDGSAAPPGDFIPAPYDPPPSATR